MFGIKISFRDGSRPLVVANVPDAETGRAIAFNANRDPNVDKVDILSADMLPATTTSAVVVIDFNTGHTIY